MKNPERAKTNPWEVILPVIAGIIVGVPAGFLVKVYTDITWLPPLVAAVVAMIVGHIVPTLLDRRQAKPSRAMDVEEPEPRRATS